MGVNDAQTEIKEEGSNEKDGIYWVKQGETIWMESKKTKKDGLKAIKYFDKAIELEPLNFLAWANKGLILKNLKRAKDALACYDRAIDIKPDYINAWYNKGILLGSTGKYNDAKKCFNKVLKLKPDHKLAKRDKKVLIEIMKQHK